MGSYGPGHLYLTASGRPLYNWRITKVGRREMFDGRLRDRKIEMRSGVVFTYPNSYLPFSKSTVIARKLLLKFPQNLPYLKGGITKQLPTNSTGFVGLYNI